jgi:hypothetical protein
MRGREACGASGKPWLRGRCLMAVPAFVVDGGGELRTRANHTVCLSRSRVCVPTPPSRMTWQQPRLSLAYLTPLKLDRRHGSVSDADCGVCCTASNQALARGPRTKQSAALWRPDRGGTLVLDMELHVVGRRRGQCRAEPLGRKQVAVEERYECMGVEK